MKYNEHICHNTLNRQFKLVNTYVYICVHMCTYVCVHMYVYICVHMCTHMCTYVYIEDMKVKTMFYNMQIAAGVWLFSLE